MSAPVYQDARVPEFSSKVLFHIRRLIKNADAIPPAAAAVSPRRQILSCRDKSGNVSIVPAGVEFEMGLEAGQKIAAAVPIGGKDEAHESFDSINTVPEIGVHFHCSSVCCGDGIGTRPAELTSPLLGGVTYGPAWRP